MPAAVAARIDDDPLDADVDRAFRLELDPVAVQLDVAWDVPGDEALRVKTNPWGPESDGRPRSDHRNSDDREAQLLLRCNP
jgi:hypothetical protein